MVSKSELTSIKHLRQPFETGRKAIEKLVVLARKMPPENQEGGWGKWSYSRGMGRGKLYSEFGSDGLAAVALGCGCDDDDNDITRASFFHAVAEWKQLPPKVRNAEEQFAYCLAAFPGGEWYHNRGGEKESFLRIFFGFQENQPGVLQLEQFGSQTQGWFAIDPLEVDPKLQFEVENVKVRQTLNLKDLDSLLRDNMVHGIFSSTRLERIFIP